MESDFKAEQIGKQLGLDAVDQAVALAKACCDCERQRIELTNEAQVQALEVELSICAEEVSDLESRLRFAGPPGDRRARRRQSLYYWVIAAILTGASFFFSVIAFEPYQVGWKGWLYCIGIAVVTPFCLNKFLEVWECRALLKTLTAIAFIGAFSSLTLLAVIRGDVLAQQVQSVQTSAVELDEENSAPMPTQNTFYQETLGLLRLTMALLAVAMELGAGLALHDARQLTSSSGEDHEELSNNRREVQRQMAALLYERKALANEPRVFVAQFWRNFYRALLTHTLRNGLTKLLMLTLFVPFLCRAQAPPAKHLHLVVEIDLSGSVGTEGHDGKTEFQKNVVGVARLLAKIPPASEVTVLGITENSFSEPYILLAAKTADDKGYFGERTGAARQQLVRAWNERSAHLQPNAPQTDILGALVVAGHAFAHSSDSDRKVLVVYSDMRQFTRDLNLEKPGIAVDSALTKTEQGEFLQALNGVEVYLLGVDAAGENVAQWNHVRQFWAAYFKKVGADLKTYSMMRELPELAP